MFQGERLRILRKKYKLSQEELADRTGLSRPSISQWENNAVTPDTENLRKVAAELKTTVAYLMGETDYPCVGSTLLTGEFPLPEPTAKSLSETYMATLAPKHIDINGTILGGSQKEEYPSVVKMDFPHSSGQIISVPIFERAYSACCGSGFPNADQIYSCAEDFIDMPTNFIGQISPDPDKRPFMIYAEGDSMIHAGITDGSQLLINPAEEVYDGESALIEYGHNKSIAVKRIYWLNGSGIEIRSANGDGWKRTFTIEEQREGLLRIIGKVVWYGNKPKRG
jgi:transcriptional regulator with XRE-family HTH domain